MKKAFSGILLLASVYFVSVSLVSAQSKCSAPDLCVGSSGEDVKNLQIFLNKQGYLELFDGVASGVFGGFTESAVQSFQSAKKLPATGIVNCATRDAINASVSGGAKAIASCPSSVQKSVTADTGTPKSALSDWYDANCKPEPVGLEYGRITPIFYTPSGMGGTELAQINKPFNVSATGLSSTTLQARITASDNQVSITPASCTNGTNSGNMGCTVTATGEPRDIYLRIFNGRTGIKPVCHKVTLHRAPTDYKLKLSIDKQQFASGEAFKVTVTGMSRAALVSAFSNGGTPFAITREGAPSYSCEFGLNMSICQGDGILSCSLLPGEAGGNPEYLCAATGLDRTGSFRYPNKNGSVKYTFTIVKKNSLFDTYTPASTDYAQSITLLKDGSQGGTTYYGGCSNGMGVDPRYPQNGCTRCDNIPNAFRSFIGTCHGLSTYKWAYLRAAGGWDYMTPPCGDRKVGDACFDSSESCKDGNSILVCRDTNPAVNQSAYHGKVIDENGEPLPGVDVKAWSVVGNMLSYAPGFSCPKTTTFASGDRVGEYSFTKSESESICFNNGYVKFTKTGYVEGSIPVGSEFDKLVPTYIMKKVGGSAPSGNDLSIGGGTSQSKEIRFPGNQVVTFIIQNALASEVEACSQGVQPGQTLPSVSECVWSPLGWASGNQNWRFDAANKTLVGTFDPSNASTRTWLERDGIKIRASFRKASDRSKVVSAELTSKVTGTPTPPVTPPSDVLDILINNQNVSNATFGPGKSLTFKIKNGNKVHKAGGLDACYEIVYREKDAFTPNTISRSADPIICNWVRPWNTSGWTASGDDLTWTISGDAADWKIPGLKIMMGIRKHNDTNQTTFVTFEVEKSPGPKAAAAVSAPVVPTPPTLPAPVVTAIEIVTPTVLEQPVITIVQTVVQPIINAWKGFNSLISFE